MIQALSMPRRRTDVLPTGSPVRAGAGDFERTPSPACASACLGVPDRPDGGDAVALERFAEPEGGGLVAHHEDGLRVELPIGLADEPEEVRLAALRRVPDDCVRLHGVDL